MDNIKQIEEIVQWMVEDANRFLIIDQDGNGLDIDTTQDEWFILQPNAAALNDETRAEIKAASLEFKAKVLAIIHADIERQKSEL